jgi:hypothetical protein
MVATAPTGTLNVNQVYQLLLNNGASQTEAANLAGISVWEAGGGNPNAINPLALNNTTGSLPLGKADYSIGLFQYNFAIPGIFNFSNPNASSRGGYTPPDLLGSLDAQAQAALNLLRSNGGRLYPTWSTAAPTAHLASIQGYANQLIGSSTANSSASPQIGSGVTDTGGQTTINPTTPTQTDTGVQGTANPTAGGVPPSPTGLNLSFGGSIQHIIFQFLLILVGLALLLGGIYLLGSGKSINIAGVAAKVAK